MLLLLPAQKRAALLNTDSNKAIRLLFILSERSRVDNSTGGQEEVSHYPPFSKKYRPPDFTHKN